MKFLEAHRTDILNNLAAHGLTNNDFSFKKKKGRIYIEQNQTKTWFSYYKKEDFFIDPDTLKRVDIGYFELKASSSDLIKLNSWSEVMREFKSWLRNV